MTELPGKVPTNGGFDGWFVDEDNADDPVEGARCAKSHSICLRAQLEHCGGRSSHWSRASSAMVLVHAVCEVSSKVEVYFDAANFTLGAAIPRFRM